MLHRVHRRGASHNSLPAPASSPLSGKLVLDKIAETYQRTAADSLPVIASRVASVEPTKTLFVERNEMIAIFSGNVEMDNGLIARFIQVPYDFSVPWVLQVNASNMEVVWIST